MYNKTLVPSTYLIFFMYIICLVLYNIITFYKIYHYTFLMFLLKVIYYNVLTFDIFMLWFVEISIIIEDLENTAMGHRLVNYISIFIVGCRGLQCFLFKGFTNIKNCGPKYSHPIIRWLLQLKRISKNLPAGQIWFADRSLDGAVGRVSVYLKAMINLGVLHLKNDLEKIC
ncbi:hypothetical protein AGLY_005069 [Aphis glycines]|uniref:Uncharacterized protein n=1 Tax=Aphis glycines TaxID=307491 RepID=A0A6G0TWK5_APHGL|nr:hypothetical protein AGLY_005069 [Aphis glycines]